MSLDSKALISSFSDDLTFGSACEILDSIDSITIEQLDKLFQSNNTLFESGNVPFFRKNKETTDENHVSGEYSDYVNFISDKLDLDSNEILKLINLFARRIKNCPKNSNSELKFIIENSESSWSNPKDDLLVYFVSSILKEQLMFFKLSLKILKYTGEIKQIVTIKDKIIKNGFNIIENLISSIDLINKLQNKLIPDLTTVDKLILTNLTNLLLEILNYFIHLILKSEKGFMNISVGNWFKLMENTNFLISLKNLSTISAGETISTIESFLTLISLLFLDLDFNLGSLVDKSSFISDPSNLNNITNNLLNSNTNPIILYAWSIILHRQDIILKSTNDNDKDKIVFLKSLSNGVLKNLEIIYLSFANEALKLNVCKHLIDCNNLISFDPIYPSILGSFVINFIPYIEQNDEIINAISTILKNSSNRIIESFFNNPSTIELLILLKAKIPLTLNPFLQLISINSNLSIEELNLLPTYSTLINSSEFFNKYSIDDQQPELVKLISDINIKLPFDKNNELSLLMKKDTKAQILSNLKSTNESLIMFLYEFNGWSLLGKILQNLSIKLSIDEIERNNSRNIILNCLNKIFLDLDEKSIEKIFISINEFIEDQDLIDIIFRIFDQSLLTKDSDLLSNCISFFDIISSKGYSYRIWSYLYKSNLFNFNLNGGLVFDILNKVEITNGSYKFIISLLKLGSTLLESSLNLNDKINVKLKSKIIENFTILSIQIFENFSMWKYENSYEKSEIGFLIVNFFNKIIELEINLINENDIMICQVFKDSFRKIIDSFLISDIEDLRSVQPLLLIIERLSNPLINLFSNDDNNNNSGLIYKKWINESFKFSIQLINLRSIVKPNLPSVFEINLYSNLSNLINAYLFNENLRIQIIDLLTQLVKANWNEKPPSMLTHMSFTHQSILLNCLYEDISNLNSNSKLKISSFKFISSVMENNQKGLSLYLITGKNVPNSDLKLLLGDLSLLNLLKSCILKINNYSSAYTYFLLHSMSLCISNWSRPCSDNEDIEFIERLIDIITQENKENGFNIWRTEIISKAIELVSLYLFVSHGKNEKCEDKIFNLLNSEKFINSLDLKFKINQRDDQFLKMTENKFDKICENRFKLSQFLVPNNDSNNNFVKSNYNLQLLEKVLNLNKEEWQSFLLDLDKISNEYQVIDSQINLAKAYGGLVTCYFNINSKKINPNYISFASSLLKINYEEGIPLEIYDQIYKGRIELAFLIVFTISKSRGKVEDLTLTTIIISTLKLLESREVNLINGLTNLKIEYYKPLLRILLISISLIKTPDFVSEYSSTLNDVFKNIICKSITILFSSIRNYTLSIPNNEFNNSPLITKQIDDILIILSLTQEFFKLKLNDDLEIEISDLMIRSGAYRAIAHIFASSHLIKFNNEEIFAGYSLAFIYEFIQRKNIAEKLIQDGIFHLLTESPIALIIQKGHITPYSNNLTIVRIHKLWVESILPIVLTLISHFGDNITIQLCKLALTFKKQFQYTIQSWLETDSLLSMSIIEETEQLVILAKLLNSLDCYNFVSTELGKPVDDVRLIPGLDTLEERKIFVNALNYLLTHPKYLALKVRNIEADVVKIDQLAEEIKSLKDSLLV